MRRKGRRVLQYVLVVFSCVSICCASWTDLGELVLDLLAGFTTKATSSPLLRTCVHSSLPCSSAATAGFTAPIVTTIDAKLASSYSKLSSDAAS